MELIPGLPNHLARESLIRVPFGSFRSMLSVSKAWNTEVRSLDFHRYRRLSGRTRPHFILALVAWPDPDPGRFPNKRPEPSHWIMVFDPETGSWTRLPPAPRLPFDNVAFCKAAGGGSKIVVITSGSIRYEVSNVVQVFDWLTGQWHQAANMPGPGRVSFGMAGDPTSQTVLVAGGETQRYGTMMRSTLLYDVAKDTWLPLADMAKERRKCDVVFHGGRFHVINMVDYNQTGFAESLDPDTWQWGPPDGKFMETKPHDYNRYWLTVKEDGDEVYRIRARLGDKVEVRRGGREGEWEGVAYVPVELEYISCVMTWREKMVVIGGPFSSDVMQHYAYVLDLKSYEWRKESLPEEDSSFADIVSGCGMDL